MPVSCFSRVTRVINDAKEPFLESARARRGNSEVRTSALLIRRLIVPSRKCTDPHIASGRQPCAAEHVSGSRTE